MSQQPEREHTVLPFPSPAPSAAQEPMIRMFGEMASWSLGQPLAAGSDDPLIQARRSGLDALIRALTGDGVRALLAILDHAVPVRHEDGSAHLELPGYSAKWLQENVPGLGHRASYRVSTLLQDHGLIITSPMPGARGAEGKQRAIISPLVGLPGEVADVTPIRRSGGPRSASKTASSTEPQTRVHDVFDASANTASSPVAQTREHVESADPSRPSTAQAFAQVSADSTEPRTGASSSESGSPSSLPSNPSAEASPGAVEVRFLLSETHGASGAASVESWSELRDALAAIERQHPGVVAAALKPIFVPVSSKAGALAKALRLPDDGDRPVSDRVAGYVAAILTSHGGRTSGVWSTLANARIHIPADTPVDAMAPRVLAAICAGLDVKVENWVRWLASALRKPVNEWTHTVTIDGLRRVLGDLLTQEAEVAPGSQEQNLSPAVDEPARDDQVGPSTGAGTETRAGDPAPLGAADMPQAPAGAAPPAAPAKRSSRVGRTSTAAAPPPAGLPPEVEEHLVAAVAWGGSEHPMARHGVDGLRAHPRIARALVAIYLEEVNALGG